jgi:hypothetical protein
MTQINYPDLTRWSPNRQLRLEIRSPDNDRVAPRIDPENVSRRFWGGFQKDFAFTVFEEATGRVISQRNAGRDDWLDSPCDAWVSDDGRIVVFTRSPFSSHVYLLGRSGETIFDCDVCQDVLDGNEREFHWTTAGSYWHQRGVGLFFEALTLHYFCFRTQLGRQVLINLDEGTLTKDLEPVAERLKDVQATWALRTVSEAARDARLFDECDMPEETWRYLSEVWAAVLWCGADKLDAAAPHLEALESSTVWSSFTSGWETPTDSRTWLVKLHFVPIAQQSLRCLGRVPLGRAAYWLCREADRNPSSRIDVPERIADRTARLQQIRVGLLPHEVVAMVGMPDVCFGVREWHYDLPDADDGPCTLLLEWDIRVKYLSSIQRLPPAWDQPYARVYWM